MPRLSTGFSREERRNHRVGRHYYFYVPDPGLYWKVHLGSRAGNLNPDGHKRSVGVREMGDGACDSCPGRTRMGLCGISSSEFLVNCRRQTLLRTETRFCPLKRAVPCGFNLWVRVPARSKTLPVVFTYLPTQWHASVRHSGDERAQSIYSAKRDSLPIHNGASRLRFCL